LSLSLPSVKLKILNYLRQNLICAWEKSLFPNQGVVHINVPFNEPLAPIVNQEVLALKDTFKNNLFFGNLKSVKPVINNVIEVPLNVWRNEEKGVIVGGLCNSEKPEEYCRAIANLSNYLNYPILAEALSPLRNYANLNSNLITNYDFILRNEELSEKLTPQIVIQIGELPTSKILREWLTKTNPQRSIIDPAGDNFDPLHGQSLHLRTTIENISNKILARGKTIHSEYQKNWLTIDKQVNQKVNQNLADNEEIFEAKIAWLLSQNLPEKTPLFIANSMPIRYMEYFWQPNNRKIIPYFSRGTNGIEGTLSTALGIAYDNQSTVILTGDLALLHDTNGFLIKQKFTGHLTIILVNNNGGGIFEMLPIADFGNNFEEYFATPQNIDFEQLCAVYGVEYKLIDNWQHFTQLIRNLPATGIRLLEIQTNRKKDAQWLREKLSQFAE
jgi:2-succinyl-5-enolpyruvyl-6-hydroxy-3-cyclohexene-1-carboxylate synthase